MLQTVALSCRYTGHTLAKFFVTLATGLVTGLTAAAAAACLEFVFWRKQQAVQYMIDVVHHKTLLAAFGLHLLITSGLLVFAACLVWSRPPLFVPIVLNLLHMKHVLSTNHQVHHDCKGAAVTQLEVQCMSKHRINALLFVQPI